MKAALTTERRIHRGVFPRRLAVRKPLLKEWWARTSHRWTRSPMSKTVVIAGASGVVGQTALNHYLEQGWDVVALSRRQPMTLSDRPFRHLSVDLRDGEATRSALESVGPVDQLVYAALYEKPGLIAGWREADQMTTTRAMLANTVEALVPSGLGHVVLLQGTKAYGVHVMPL
ncbi:MAG: NAD-dependent epimerase/dehydratase family protein, partial [Actinobacteria bacterium]|nr:NAD-dependent epimerase/dehydratase family protein [Actinomycetota bacterium]